MRLAGKMGVAEFIAPLPSDDLSIMLVATRQYGARPKCWLLVLIRVRPEEPANAAQRPRGQYGQSAAKNRRGLAFDLKSDVGC